MLLCLRHTIGFEGLFALLPSQSANAGAGQEPEPTISAAKVPERIGRGYEPPHQVHISDIAGWLHGLLKSLANGN